jgi:adenosine deaminase
MIDENLPFIDLHRHLDGNVRLETVLDLGNYHQVPLPAQDLESLRPYIQVTEPQPGVMAFIARFHWLTVVMVDYDSCRRIAYENVEDAKKEGMDYVELRFSPCFMAQANHLNPVGVVEAVIDGIRAGRRDFDMPVNLIGIISRTYGPQMGWLELNALLTQRNELVALDLAGDEHNWPGELFVDHFYRAREVGWQVTVHAGEIEGPESIWQALRDLKATRIGHAVRALEDLVLVDYIRDHDVGVESSLTSNVQTTTVPDYSSHPLKKFLQLGIKAAICSDDPGISRIDLRHEYEVAAPAAGLSTKETSRAQLNALEIAFLTEQEKKDLLQKKRSVQGNEFPGSISHLD